MAYGHAARHPMTKQVCFLLDTHVMWHLDVLHHEGCEGYGSSVLGQSYGTMELAGSSHARTVELWNLPFLASRSELWNLPVLATRTRVDATYH